MQTGEACEMLKIYVGDEARWEGHSLHTALLRKLKELGVAGVTVTRGIAGYGEGKAIHTERLLTLSDDLPIVLEAVDRKEKIQEVIPVLQEMVTEGLMLVTEVTVLHYGKKRDTL